MIQPRYLAWLVKELARQEGDRVVSIEAARKWLSGKTMPDQAQMAMLGADWDQLPPQFKEAE